MKSIWRTMHLDEPAPPYYSTYVLGAASALFSADWARLYHEWGSAWRVLNVDGFQPQRETFCLDFETMRPLPKRSGQTLQFFKYDDIVNDQVQSLPSPPPELPDKCKHVTYHYRGDKRMGFDEVSMIDEFQGLRACTLCGEIETKV